MSDFFISQVLVFLPLLLFLVRPFSKMLRRLNGVSVFPLLSLVIEIAAIFAFGFRVEMIPAVLCCVVLFLTSLARLVMFFLGLPTDEVRVGSIVFCSIGLVFFITCAYITYAIRPQPAPEVSTTMSIHRHQLQVYQTRSGGFAIKTEARDLLQQTKANCTVWAPVKEQYTGNPCPVIYYIPGAQVDSHARETMARILAGNGYIVIAADFPQRKYVSAPKDFLLRSENILAFRQLSLFLNNGKQTNDAVQRNNAWLQSSVNDLHQMVQALLSEPATTSGVKTFREQLPPYTVAEPYFVIEQFSTDTIPDINRAGLKESAGIVVLSNGTPVTQTPQMLTVEITDGILSENCIEHSVVLLTGTPETLVPYGEAYVQHPVFAGFSGLSAKSHPELLEQMTAYKIRAYFDRRQSRPISVMQ